MQTIYILAWTHCNLPSTHGLEFPGDEAQCARAVCPLSTHVNTQNTGSVRRRLLPSCMRYNYHFKKNHIAPFVIDFIPIHSVSLSVSQCIRVTPIHSVSKCIRIRKFDWDSTDSIMLLIIIRECGREVSIHVGICLSKYPNRLGHTREGFYSYHIMLKRSLMTSFSKNIDLGLW
jgi:hypothetical protein